MPLDEKERKKLKAHLDQIAKEAEELTKGNAEQDALYDAGYDLGTYTGVAKLLAGGVPSYLVKRYTSTDANFKQDLNDMLDAMAAGSTQAATLGWSDDAIAAAKGTTEEERAAANAELEALKNKNLLTLGSGVVGETIGTIPYALGQGALIAKAGLSGLKALAVDAGINALLGGIGGAGAGETKEEKIKSGLVGTALGAALPVVVAGSGKLATEGAAALQNALTKETPSVTDVVRNQLISNLPDVEMKVLPTEGKSPRVVISNEGNLPANTNVLKRPEELRARNRDVEPKINIYEAAEPQAKIIQFPQKPVQPAAVETQAVQKAIDTTNTKNVPVKITEVQEAPDVIKPGKESIVKEIRNTLEQQKLDGTHQDIKVVDGKVVDKDGNQLTLYRGTKHADRLSQGPWRNFQYFTDNPYVGATFANKGYFTKATVTDFKNPFIYDAKGAVFDSIPVKTKNGVAYVDADAIVRRAKEEGYDSVIIKNIAALRGKQDIFGKGSIKPNNVLNSFIVAFDDSQIAKTETKKLEEVIKDYTSAEDFISGIKNKPDNGGSVGAMRASDVPETNLYQSEGKLYEDVAPEGEPGMLQQLAFEPETVLPTKSDIEVPVSTRRRETNKELLDKLEELKRTTPEQKPGGSSFYAGAQWANRRRAIERINREIARRNISTKPAEQLNLLREPTVSEQIARELAAKAGVDLEPMFSGPLGTGKTGNVYLGTNVAGEPRAVKIINPQPRSGDPIPQDQLGISLTGEGYGTVESKVRDALENVRKDLPPDVSKHIIKTHHAAEVPTERRFGTQFVYASDVYKPIDSLKNFGSTLDNHLINNPNPEYLKQVENLPKKERSFVKALLDLTQNRGFKFNPSFNDFHEKNIMQDVKTGDYVLVDVGDMIAPNQTAQSPLEALIERMGLGIKKADSQSMRAKPPKPPKLPTSSAILGEEEPTDWQKIPLERIKPASTTEAQQTKSLEDRMQMLQKELLDASKQFKQAGGNIDQRNYLNNKIEALTKNYNLLNKRNHDLKIDRIKQQFGNVTIREPYVDEFDGRQSFAVIDNDNNSFKFIGHLAPDGKLTLTVRTAHVSPKTGETLARSTNIDANKGFAAVEYYFGKDNIKTIEAHWLMDDPVTRPQEAMSKNAMTFQKFFEKFKSQGLDDDSALNSAARQTWTAKQAIRRGYNISKIKEVEYLKNGRLDSVTVEFSKSPKIPIKYAPRPAKMSSKGISGNFDKRTVALAERQRSEKALTEADKRLMDYENANPSINMAKDKKYKQLRSDYDYWLKEQDALALSVPRVEDYTVRYNDLASRLERTDLDKQTREELQDSLDYIKVEWLKRAYEVPELVEEIDKNHPLYKVYLENEKPGIMRALDLHLGEMFDRPLGRGVFGSDIVKAKQQQLPLLPPKGKK